MLIFKALHVLSMVLMVAAVQSGAFLEAYGTVRRDVHALAVFHRTGQQARLSLIGTVALAAGIGFGLLTAATGSLDFFAGWLIAAYVLVGLFLLNFAVIGRPVIEHGAQAVEAEEGSRSADDVARAMAPRRALLFLALMSAILTALILDMVLKPF